MNATYLELAIVSVPHTPGCDSLMLGYECTCYRDARIAHGIAAGLLVYRDAWYDDAPESTCDAAFLHAFRKASAL